MLLSPPVWLVFSVAPPAEPALASASWTVIPSPDIGVPLANGVLYGVSCGGSTACVAVGSYFDGNVSESGAAQTLVESWNGSVWTVAGSPNALTQTKPTLRRCHVADLLSVSPSAITSMRTVDYDTLVELWNGSVWSIAPSPNASIQNSLQGGCRAAPPRGCTAVGSYYAGGTSFEHAD